MAPAQEPSTTSKLRRPNRRRLPTAATKSSRTIDRAIATFKVRCQICVQVEGPRFERREKRAADIDSLISPGAPSPEEFETCEGPEEIQVEEEAPQNETDSSGDEDVDMGPAAGGNGV